MGFNCTFVFLLVVLLSGTAAQAAERGTAIRTAELKAEPFVDAAVAGTVAADQQVTIVSRQGGWAQVKDGATTGWLRVLNIRLAAGSAPGAAAKPNSMSKSASLLRTGSSGKTVTTGVKGLDEEDIRSASVNEAELQELATLAVAADEAKANAKASGLKESSVEYFKGASGK